MVKEDTPEAFYERGCQEKQLPSNRPPKAKTPRGSQPRFRRDENWHRQSIAGIFHHNTDLSSATEKRASDLMPTIVLSEPRGLPLFQVVRGGIECNLGLGTCRGPTPPRILTLDPNRCRQSGDELLRPSCCRRIVCYGDVVVFSCLRSNSFPFFHRIKAIAAILRARVSRAISARMPLCFNRSRYGL